MIVKHGSHRPYLLKNCFLLKESSSHRVMHGQGFDNSPSLVSEKIQ